MTDVVRRQTRRKVFLEALSLVAPIGSAIFFSGRFVVSWPLPTTLAVTGLSAVALMIYWIWHRSTYPASIAPWGSSDEPDDPADEVEDEGGRWDLFMIVLTVVGVTTVVVLGIVARFVLALLVIVLFAAAHSGSELGDVASAVLAMLGVSFVVEVGVVIPLSRVWDLSIDEEPPDRGDFCPVPTDGSR
jgi:hypothetical protein